MIILKFDPWHFTDTTQLINQFLIRLANEFLSEKDKQLNNIGELLTKYSSAFELAEYLPVPWLNKAISIFGKAGAKFAGKKLQKGIKGKETTPFLLAKVAELTGGDSLASNIELVFNNAKVAAQTAVAYCAL